MHRRQRFVVLPHQAVSTSRLGISSASSSLTPSRILTLPARTCARLHARAPDPGTALSSTWRLALPSPVSEDGIEASKRGKDCRYDLCERWPPGTKMEREPFLRHQQVSHLTKLLCPLFSNQRADFQTHASHQSPLSLNQKPSPRSHVR